MVPLDGYQARFTVDRRMLHAGDRHGAARLYWDVSWPYLTKIPVASRCVFSLSCATVAVFFLAE